MQVPLNRKVVIGVVGAAALAAAGGTYAATRGGQASVRPAGLLAQRQALLDDVAKRLKVSTTDLTAAIQGAFADRLDAAVKAGTLTQAQADAIKARMRQKGGPPFPPFLLGPRFALKVPPGMHGPFGPGLRRKGFPGLLRPGLPPRFRRGAAPLLLLPFFGPALGAGPFAIFDAAAKYLGLTDRDLRARLAAGKSLAQIATDQGKSVDGLEAALKDAVHGQLDKAAAAFDARVDELVHRSPLRPAFGRRR
jgi:hypothetical protein